MSHPTDLDASIGRLTFACVVLAVLLAADFIYEWLKRLHRKPLVSDRIKRTPKREREEHATEEEA